MSACESCGVEHSFWNGATVTGVARGRTMNFRFLTEKVILGQCQSREKFLTFNKGVRVVCLI